MEIKRILTGSAEHFDSSGHDKDYLIVDDAQEEIYTQKHDKATNTCEFRYKNVSGDELLTWFTGIENGTGNKDLLNLACLNTKKFTDHFKIDPVTDQRVFDMFKLWFMADYRIPNRDRYKKWVYHPLMFMFFRQNGEMKLTPDQKQICLDAKNCKYHKEEFRKMYEFYGWGQQFEIALKQIKEWT